MKRLKQIFCKHEYKDGALLALKNGHSVEDFINKQDKHIKSEYNIIGAMWVCKKCGKIKQYKFK